MDCLHDGRRLPMDEVQEENDEPSLSERILETKRIPLGLGSEPVMSLQEIAYEVAKLEKALKYCQDDKVVMQNQIDVLEVELEQWRIEARDNVAMGIRPMTKMENLLLDEKGKAGRLELELERKKDTIEILKGNVSNAISDYRKIKEQLQQARDWLELIGDVAYDYDGYREAESLMKLIDELREMAGKALKGEAVPVERLTGTKEE